MAIITNFLRGYFGTYAKADNELELVSTMRDPGAFRMGVLKRLLESNLGKWSWNTVREDGTHDEHAYAQGRMMAGVDGGAMYIATRAPGQEDCKERFYIDSGQAVFRVPVSAPNLGAGAVTGKFAIRTHHGFYLCVTPEGRLETRTNPGPWETFSFVRIE
jgi:hypothetical protein